MGAGVEWARLTGPDIRAVAAQRDALAVLPIGLLEQHGPHLPVITDTASAAFAEALHGANAGPRTLAAVGLEGIRAALDADTASLRRDG